MLERTRADMKEANEEAIIKRISVRFVRPASRQ